MKKKISRTIGKAFAWGMAFSFMVAVSALDCGSLFPFVWMLISGGYLAALAKHHGYMM